MDQRTPTTSGGRRLSDYQPPPGEVNKDEYKQTRRQRHAEKRAPVANHHIQGNTTSNSMFTFAGFDDAQRPPESISTPQKPNVEYRNGSALYPLLENAPSDQQPRIAKRPASPSMEQFNATKRQQTESSFYEAVTAPIRPATSSNGGTLSAMDIDSESFSDEAVTRGWEEVQAQQEEQQPSLQQTPPNCNLQVEPRYTKQAARSRTGSINGQNLNHQQNMMPPELSPRQQPTLPGNLPLSRQPTPSSRRQTPYQQHNTPQKSQFRERAPRTSETSERAYPRASSQSRIARSQSVHPDVHNTHNSFFQGQDWVHAERGRQPTRETDNSHPSLRQVSTSRMRHQTTATEAATGQSRNINQEKGSSFSHSRLFRRDPSVARSNATAQAQEIAFQHYADRQASVPRQQTPNAQRGPGTFDIDEMDSDSSDIETMEKIPRNLEVFQKLKNRHPNLELREPFQRAATVGLDYGYYENMVKTPQGQARQKSIHTPISYQQPLASPIWPNKLQTQLPSSLQTQESSYINEQSSSVHSRSRDALLNTPSMQLVRSQSRSASVYQGSCASSQVPVNGFLEQPHAKPRTPPTPGRETLGRDEPQDNEISEAETPKQSARSVHTPKTSNKKPIKARDIIDDGYKIHDTPMEDLLKLTRRKEMNIDPRQENAAGAYQRFRLPERGVFKKDLAAKQGQSTSQTIKAETPQPRPRIASGRGFQALQEREVIDLISPESGTPMKERLNSAAKKPTPKKPVFAPRAKTPRAEPLVKRAAKSKEEKLPPEVLRQQRAAEVIVSKEIRGVEEALDEALFGEIVHDQAAEDRKAKEARAAARRERERKLAEHMAKEKAAQAAEAEKKRKLAEETEKRRLEKEQEEEQKRIKREAERKRALAQEKLEQEMLRRKAEEQIRANREKAAEEERHRELEKQKVAKAAAEAAAKLKAKQEEAKKQAASLSATKVSSVEASKPAEEDVLMNNNDSLFIPEVPVTASSTATPDNSATAPHALDNAAEIAKSTTTTPGNIAQIFAAQNAAQSSNRTEKDAEEGKLAAERAMAARRKVDTRWALKAQASKLASHHSAPPIIGRPKPTPCPELVTEKAKSTTTAPSLKKDCPPPKSKGNPRPKPKPASNGKANDSFESESSSSSATTHSYLEQLAAKPLYQAAPLADSLTSVSRTKKTPGEPESSEYKHKVQLISEIERENLEKANKEKRAAARRSNKTAAQNADQRKKRAEAARKKKIQDIKNDAELNGIDISEEEINRQVGEFMEKREKGIEKRRIGSQKKQGSGSGSGERPNPSQPFQPSRPSQPPQPQVEDADAVDENLSPEGEPGRQLDRDKKAAIAALAAARNNGFDQASRIKTVGDLYPESEESEEDPDDEPGVPAEKSKGTVDNRLSDEDEDDDTESLSSSEDEEPSSPPPEMSDSLKQLAAQADVSAENAMKCNLNDASNALSFSSTNSNPPAALVMLYQVMKKELIKASSSDEEDRIHTHMVDQFLSLASANALAQDIMSKWRNYAHISLSEWYKDGKFKGCIAHDDLRESTIYIVSLIKSSSEFQVEDLAAMPVKMPATCWVVVQYMNRRARNDETGEVEVHHQEPKIVKYFSVLQMANHEACKRLIELIKPPGARIDQIDDHAKLAKQARDGREVADQEGEPFEVEMEPLPWITEWTSLTIKVEKWDIEGPRN